MSAGLRSRRFRLRLLLRPKKYRLRLRLRPKNIDSDSDCDSPSTPVKPQASDPIRPISSRNFLSLPFGGILEPATATPFDTRSRACRSLFQLADLPRAVLGEVKYPPSPCLASILDRQQQISTRNYYCLIQYQFNVSNKISFEKMSF